MITGSIKRTAVLMVNLGTPEAPSTSAVRRYLAQFLSDRRVVDQPRFLWWLVLHGIILRTRPAKSARAYRTIWTDDGSPLLVHTQRLAAAVGHLLTEPRIDVSYAMCYGNPALEEAVASLCRSRIDRLIVLPLYPQFSSTTTGAAYDAVARALKENRWNPEVRLIRDYHCLPPLIALLSSRLSAAGIQPGTESKLLFSFHGLPVRYIEQGDPYADQCRATAEAVAENLGLAGGDWELVYQSRMGRDPWLAPNIQERLPQLAAEGVKAVTVICPGFATDCLETLEEVAMGNRTHFLNSGGSSYRYVPCLNDDPEHAAVLAELVRGHLW